MVSAYFLRMLWCLTWKKESNQVLLLLSQKQILGKQNTILLHNFSLIQPFSCIMLRTLRAQQQSCLWFVFFFFLFFSFSFTFLWWEPVNCSPELSALVEWRSGGFQTRRGPCVHFLNASLCLFSSIFFSLLGKPSTAGVWTQPGSFSPPQQKHQSPRLDQKFFFQGTFALSDVQSLLIEISRSNINFICHMLMLDRQWHVNVNRFRRFSIVIIDTKTLIISVHFEWMNSVNFLLWVETNLSHWTHRPATWLYKLIVNTNNSLSANHRATSQCKYGGRGWGRLVEGMKWLWTFHLGWRWDLGTSHRHHR